MQKTGTIKEGEDTAKNVYVGDIVMLYGKKHVLIYKKNGEDFSSTSYYRDYFFCPIQHLPKGYRKVLSEAEFETLKSRSTVIKQRGTKHDEYKVCKDEAPFEIRPLKVWEIRRKKKKTATIYE